MCKNATSVIGAEMNAIEPELKSFLAVIGQADTPDGLAAVSAYDAAKTAFTNWTPGTSAELAVEALNAFNAVFQTLPVPTEAKALEGIIEAGVAITIGLLTGNSTTDAAAHATIAADTHAKVQALVPSYKESLWDKARADLGDHSIVANKQKHYWNQEVTEAAKVDPKYATLKQT